MNHLTTPQFWECYHRLPSDVRELADKNFAMLKRDPRHPSLQFKQIQGVWSVRVGRRYRALAMQKPNGMLWFWVGSHAEYDRLIR